METDTNQETLAKLEYLEQLYRSGYKSGTVDTTIDKLVAMEAAAMQRELAGLGETLRAFESQYSMASEEFYRRFREGTVGDAADFFEWSATYQMWLAGRERLVSLGVAVE